MCQRAERDENTCRADFKPTELARLGMALEKLERPKAKKRQSDGGSVGGEIAGRGRPKGAKKGSDNFTEANEPQDKPPKKAYVREIVGDAIGMSGITYERAKRVVEAAEEEAVTHLPNARDAHTRPAFRDVWKHRPRSR